MSVRMDGKPSVGEISSRPRRFALWGRGRRRLLPTARRPTLLVHAVFDAAFLVVKVALSRGRSALRSVLPIPPVAYRFTLRPLQSDVG